MDVTQPLTLGQKLSPLKDVLLFKPRQAAQKIKGNGRAFFPIALTLLLILSLSHLLRGVTLTSVTSLLTSLILLFINVGLLYFFGRHMFHGESTFYDLFSSLAYVDMFAIYTILLLVLSIFSPFLFIVAIVSLFYLVYAFIVAVGVAHTIQGWQAFILLLIVGIISYVLQLGVGLLFNMPAGNVVGQAIHLVG